MRAFDARISVVTNEVASGENRLGSGQLVATLEDGQFSLDPLKVAIPAGSVDVRISFAMTHNDVVATTKVKIERLDYGVLARRLDPQASADGWLTLDLDLQSRSKSLENMLDGASGHFDFAVWSKNIQGDIFDLWAANLVLAIVPRIDSGPQSRVNCVVGVLDSTDVVMRPKKILIDTTNVQVVAVGEVDFKTRKFEFVLKPKPKRPKMFTLATPIRVSGGFSDFRVGTTPEELIITVVRFAASVLAPLQRLFVTSIPADGEAACLAAMRRSSP